MIETLPYGVAILIILLFLFGLPTGLFLYLAHWLSKRQKGGNIEEEADNLKE